MPTTNLAQLLFFTKTHIKRYYGLAIIHFMGLLYFFPLQLYLQRYWMPSAGSGFDHPTFYENVLNLNKHPFAVIVLFNITLVYAILATRSINHKPEFTRLFTLPLNRKMLFLGNIVASILLYIIPVVLTYLSLWAMAVALGPNIQNAVAIGQQYMDQRGFGPLYVVLAYGNTLGHWLLVHLGFGLVCLGTAILAHIIFTFSSLQLIGTMIIHVLPPGFILLVDFLVSGYLLGYGPSRVSEALFYSSPAFYFINLNFRSTLWVRLMNPPFWFWLIFSIYLVGSFVLAYWLFSKSKLESKGDLLVIPELQLPFVMLGTLGASLLCGLITFNITKDNIIGLVGYGLGLMFGFAVCQMIVQRCFAIRFKNSTWLQFAASVVVFLGIWVPVAFDWYGYSEMPISDISQIESVEIYYQHNAIGPTSRTFCMLNEDEAIKNATKVYRSVLQLVPTTFWYKADSSSLIEFTFSDKNNRTYIRYFYDKDICNHSSVRDALSKYYSTESYINARFSLLSQDSRLPGDAYPKTIVIKKGPKHYEISDIVQIVSLIEAMREDYKANPMLLNEQYMPLVTIFDGAEKNYADLFGYNTKALKIIESIEGARALMPDSSQIAHIKLLPVVKLPNYNPEIPMGHVVYSDFWQDDRFKADVTTTENSQEIIELFKRPRTYEPLSINDLAIYIRYKDGTEEQGFISQ